MDREATIFVTKMRPIIKPKLNKMNYWLQGLNDNKGCKAGDIVRCNTEKALAPSLTSI